MTNEEMIKMVETIIDEHVWAEETWFCGQPGTTSVGHRDAAVAIVATMQANGVIAPSDAGEASR